MNTFNRYYRVNNAIIYLFSLLAVIIFIALIMPDLGADEPFTISLVKHSFRQIIDIDMFDVHPPLYYLILKSFLIITTFWTKNIIIKIIFARLLSFMCFLISCFFLINALKLLHVKVNYFWQIIIIYIYPSIAQYSLTIRMYQFSAMLLAIEIYGLLLFKINISKKSTITSVIYIVISVSLSLNINYFGAAFAGSLLIIEMFDYISRKCLKKSLIIFIIGLIDIISFFPSYLFLRHQLAYVSSNNYSNFINVSLINRNIFSQLLGALTGHSITGIFSLLIGIIMLIIEILFVLNILNKNTAFSRCIIKIYLAFVIGFLPFVILSFIKHPMIMGRYGFPIFFIIYFFMIAYILKVVRLQRINQIVLFCICLFLLFLGLHIFQSSVSNDIQSLKDIRMSTEFLNSNHKYLDLNGVRAIQCSTYSNYNNKIIKSNKLPIKSTLASNNNKLMLKIFSNIHYVKDRR